jgi:hypothetical protein
MRRSSAVLGDQRVDDLGGAGERVERVFDLVGDAGDDLAERGEAAGVDQLVDEAALLGERDLQLASAAALELGEPAGGRADAVVEQDLEGLLEAAGGVVVVVAGGEGVREVDERGDERGEPVRRAGRGGTRRGRSAGSRGGAGRRGPTRARGWCRSGGR